jgi:hypothetical protein
MKNKFNIGDKVVSSVTEKTYVITGIVRTLGNGIDYQLHEILSTGEEGLWPKWSDEDVLTLVEGGENNG